MQLRVLDCDRKLCRERREESRLVLREHASLGGKDGEKPDDLVLGEQRQCDHNLDPGLGGGVGDRGQAGLGGHVFHDEQPARAERSESELQQPLGQTFVRPGEPDARCRKEPILLTQVHRKPIGGEQLPDARDCRLERVRERQLRDRLAYDREEGTCTPELELDCACVHARAQGVSCTHAECGQRCELRVAGFRSRAVEELQHADRRLPERKGRRPGRSTRRSGDALHGRRMPSDEGSLRGGPRGFEGSVSDLADRRLHKRQPTAPVASNATRTT